MVNVASGVWANALSHPDRVALLADSKEWTYESLWAAAALYGGALQATGIKQGDRVLLIAPSVPEFAVAYYSLQLIGATAITMNTMATASEIDYVVEDSGTVMVIAWHESATAAAKVAAARGLQIWLLEPGAAVVDATPVEVPMVLDPQSTAVILYTSGTTGRPKGAELTVANLLGCSDAFMEVLELDINDRFGTGLPLFHVFGQAVVMNTVLRLGASLSLLHPFDPNEMLAMMKEDELTAVAGVPTMWNAMLHASGNYTADNFAALRMALSGGASLPAEVVRAFSERLGCVILEGYGLTETTGAATFNGLNREAKIGSVGIALPDTQIEVRDPYGTPVPTGEAGEIFVKGPTVMKGYWQHPEATEHDLQDGWLKTGDLGLIDEDGDVRIVDRAKDLIIRGGYNVYPREVEEVLYEHPAIVEVAVVGVPDDHYGEEIAAVIVLAAGQSVTGEEIRVWAKEQLSAYKVPRLFQFVERLPKGATGKILKRGIDLDDLAAQSAARRART